MFLAYNNGISATANEVEFVKNKNGIGLLLSAVKDLQIVNGGQTTASIYHTWKKDKADISNIFVQVKLSVVKNKDNFSTIVSRISEYANTQNKVSIADLSSNRPYHIEFEKLSRSIFTPISDSRNIQTKWFYERARGQYKNARLKESLPKSRLKAFDLKTPKNQVFTKEELAKYINAYEEITDGKKILIAPHYVVRGNQKNYIQFINHNLEKKLNNIYFEDTIAKAILFKATEKVYGVKPNAIGDMRYISVPYTIGLLTHITSNQIDLYKIWRNQEISSQLKELLFEMMTAIEKFIKSIAPGGLYGEWAKKEDCWIQVKAHKFNFDTTTIKQDFIDKKSSVKRQIITEEEANQTQTQEEYERLKAIPYKVWKKIEEYGNDTKLLTEYQCTIVFNLAGRVRTNSKIPENEKAIGLKVLDLIIEKAPELLFDVDDIVEADIAQQQKLPDITIELIKKMVIWEKKNKKLKDHHYKLLEDILVGKQQLTEQNKKFCSMNYQTLCKYGFK